MLKKLQQKAQRTYNQHFNQEKYEQMKEEEIKEKQNFDLFNQVYVEGMENDNPDDQKQQSQEKQQEEQQEQQQIPLDFTKAIIPEELVQQMQEQEIQQIAIENQQSKAKKKQTNQDLPNFLTQKICLDENGENYYEKAAKQAKLENSAMFKLTTYVSEKADNAKKQVKKQLKKLDAHVKKKILEKKSHINLWIAGQVDTQIVSIMSKMEPKIAQSIEKSVPFDWLSGFVHDSAINLWKDFTDLVRLELRIKITPPKVEIKKREQKGPIYAFRNFILYALYPADLTTRNHMRRISFVMIKLCCLLPYLGLQPIMFSIILICINKDEEYQLVNYIADIKSLQFLTNGLLPCIIAYFHYFFFDEGPGNHQMLHVILTTIFVYQINIWIAYFLLQRSYSKGAFLKEQLTINQDDKGGRLKYFLIYDLICFLIIIGISILIYIFKTKDNPNHKLGDLLYLTRTIYAFLSFPFIIFLIPFFVKMLTNAIPTGYDQYGNCIPSLNSIQMSYREVPFDRSEQVDIEEIIDRDEDQKDEKQIEINQEENKDAQKQNKKKEKEKKKGFTKTT